MGKNSAQDRNSRSVFDVYIHGFRSPKCAIGVDASTLGLIQVLVSGTLTWKGCMGVLDGLKIGFLCHNYTRISTLSIWSVN